MTDPKHYCKHEAGFLVRITRRGKTTQKLVHTESQAKKLASKFKSELGVIKKEARGQTGHLGVVLHENRAYKSFLVVKSPRNVKTFCFGIAKYTHEVALASAIESRRLGVRTLVTLSEAKDIIERDKDESA